MSLSGTVAPGPITAAALAAGMRHRHAGLLIGAGHIVVELPLILLLAGGAGVFLSSDGVRAAIGLVGGLFLAWMGVQLLRAARKPETNNEAVLQRHPLWIGIVLTGANPYFLLWWLTVGLALATQAMEFGIAAVALFAVAHWACDIGWLEVLSFAGHKGSSALQGRSRGAVFAICALALLFFGAKFIFDAAAGLMALTGSTG